MSGGTGRGTARIAASVEEEHLRALPGLTLLWLSAWCAFYGLDLYVCLVLEPRTAHLAWFTAWRLVGAAVVLTTFVAARMPNVSLRRFRQLEVSVYYAATTCLSLMAIEHGGLTSRYVQGISAVIMMWVLAVPTRWQRSLALSAFNLLIYPGVMAVAALFDPAINAQWHTPAALALFAHDYVFVFATAALSAASSDFLWRSRRQLYEARRLGRYRLKAQIGAGGMGAVWLAYDDTLQRDVALKILQPTEHTHAGATARFEREALAASRLSSPHTVRVFDYGASDDGVWFIAMEYLVGMDLSDLVHQRGPLAPEHVAHLARQVCESLAEAHGAGIVHRDVKPENLFVMTVGDDLDHVKLIDFGVARLVRSEGDATLTQAGWLGGTPAYMSPEACAGGEVGAPGEVYSLGAVLYFLLTGTPPFQAQNAAAAMLAHVRETPARPSERLGAPVPEAMERIVLRCLAKSPHDRFPTMRALDAELARFLETSPWTAPRAREFWGRTRHVAHSSRPPAGTEETLVASRRA
jgi:serine/threonine-protein kinase